MWEPLAIGAPAARYRWYNMSTCALGRTFDKLSILLAPELTVGKVKMFRQVAVVYSRKCKC